MTKRWNHSKVKFLVDTRGMFDIQTFVERDRRLFKIEVEMMVVYHLQLV